MYHLCMRVPADLYKDLTTMIFETEQLDGIGHIVTQEVARIIKKTGTVEPGKYTSQRPSRKKAYGKKKYWLQVGIIVAEPVRNWITHELENNSEYNGVGDVVISLLQPRVNKWRRARAAAQSLHSQ